MYFLYYDGRSSRKWAARIEKLHMTMVHTPRAMKLKPFAHLYSDYINYIVGNWKRKGACALQAANLSSYLIGVISICIYIYYILDVIWRLLLNNSFVHKRRMFFSSGNRIEFPKMGAKPSKLQPKSPSPCLGSWKSVQQQEIARNSFQETWHSTVNLHLWNFECFCKTKQLESCRNISLVNRQI